MSDKLAHSLFIILALGLGTIFGLASGSFGLGLFSTILIHFVSVLLYEYLIVEDEEEDHKYYMKLYKSYIKDVTDYNRQIRSYSTRIAALNDSIPFAAPVAAPVVAVEPPIAAAPVVEAPKVEAPVEAPVETPVVLQIVDSGIKLDRFE